jgi:hypothetical protein
MKGRAKWRWFMIVVVVALALVAAWRLVPRLLIPSASAHYKLSVDIDDNGVLRHGEGVIGVLFQSQGPLLIGANMAQWSASTVGEAFAINFGERGALFVLLFGDGPRNKRNGREWGSRGYSPDAGRQALWSYFGFVVNDLPNGFESKAKIDAFATGKNRAELEAAALPLLVRFRNPDDPSTVEIIDPDHLDAAFGPGAKIKNVWAEITNEPVTRGVADKLTWLAQPARDQMRGPYWDWRDPEAKDSQYHLLKTYFETGGRDDR